MADFNTVGLDDIIDVSPLEEIFVDITTSKKRDKLTVAIVDDRIVRKKSVAAALSHKTRPEFILTIPRSVVWTGEAIEFVRSHQMGWGGIGELYRAIDADDVSTIQKKEYDFVERGLRQHDKVTDLVRVFDRVFEVHRPRFDPITVVLINEYELTAEHIRHAKVTYGHFNAILKTNPNGRTTGNAFETAEQMSVDIFSWGEFLGRLNKP